MTKKWTIGFSVIVLCVVVYYGQFWIRYYLATEKSNKEAGEAKCKDGIADEFSGTIEKVQRYEYSDFMKKKFFALEIKTTDSSDKFRTYQFNLEEYRDVLEFVATGQEIKKVKGQDTFVLRTNHGQEMNFTIPDCRLIGEEKNTTHNNVHVP
ncbi:MAG: hypothetical protein JSS79_10425 [Bacteroidetes bacterium]|nr:hypothetical protein [Bacteroidota bacterium]